MEDLTKKEAERIIDAYFSKDKLDSNETKKIKKLAMKHRIRLGKYRKRFCKKCYSDLSSGKIRVSRDYKYAICSSCGKRNSWKIK